VTVKLLEWWHGGFLPLGLRDLVLVVGGGAFLFMVCWCRRTLCHLRAAAEAAELAGHYLALLKEDGSDAARAAEKLTQTLRDTKAVR
jgi:hypothetical protein